MGYLGMFAGVLVLFQITQVPVVQGYWLLAVAYLISGRWPTGVPPAWRTGRAEPWPLVRRDAGAAGGPRRRARSAGACGPKPAPKAEPQPARTRRPSSARAHPLRRRPSASASAALRPGRPERSPLVGR